MNAYISKLVLWHLSTSSTTVFNCKHFYQKNFSLLEVIADKNALNLSRRDEISSEIIIIYNNSQNLYSAFYHGKQSVAAYYFGVRKIVKVISLHLNGATGQVHTWIQHLDCNVSHERHLPDALRLTEQLRLSILPKDTNTLALVGLELMGE